jgi:RND family efflux transporter MFP subunit
MFPFRFRVIPLAALALLPGACSPHTSHSNQAPALPSAKVAVEPATFSSSGGREEIIGSVRPVLAAAVSAKVSGAIAAVSVVPGAIVKRGDLLATIDAREIQARLDQASAASIAATQERQRVERMFATKAVSQKELDAAVARSDSASGALAEARTMLDYTRVTAPFDGVVVRKLCDVGDLAQPGRVLFEMEDPRALRLEVEVPEQLGELIRIGDTIPVRIDSAAFQGEGRVDEIEPAIRGASRTFLTRITLPPHDTLRSGQFGRALLQLKAQGGVWVSDAAIVSRGQLDLVFVVANDKAQLRIVRVGRRESGKAEILAGLDEHESVAVTNASSLADGQPIEVQ